MIKFKVNEITEFQKNKLIKNEHYNIYFGDTVLDTDLVQVDENNCLLFSPDVPVIINDMYFDKGILNLLEVNEYNIISIKDKFGNTIVSPITTSAQAAFVNIEDNCIVIKIEDRHRDYPDPIFPIFKVDYEYLNNDNYLGKLYTEFSPLTIKEKYLVKVLPGPLDYISSHFNIFVKDSMNSNIFNSLGLLDAGDTIFITDDNNYIVKKYTFFDLKDKYILAKDPDNNDEMLEIPYEMFIYSNNRFYYSQEDTLVYISNDDNSHIENEEILSLLNNIDYYDIDHIINHLKEFTETENISDEEKKEYSDILDVYISAYNKLTNIISKYERLMYIKDNKIYEITKTKLEDAAHWIEVASFQLT